MQQESDSRKSIKHETAGVMGSGGEREGLPLASAFRLPSDDEYDDPLGGADVTEHLESPLQQAQRGDKPEPEPEPEDG